MSAAVRVLLLVSIVLGALFALKFAAQSLDGPWRIVGLTVLAAILIWFVALTYKWEIQGHSEQPGEGIASEDWERHRKQLNQARRVQEQTRETDLGRVLQQLGMVGKRDLAEAKAAEMGFPFVDLERIRIEPKTFDGIPIDLLRTHRMLPLKREGNNLWAAFASIGDVAAQDALRDATGCRIFPCMCDPHELDKKLAILAE